VQPNAPKALMHKAQLQIEALEAAQSKDEKDWEAARQVLIRAVKAAPNDPMILEAYYDSFASQRVFPPVGAQNGLYRAFELLPHLDRLRYKVAWDFEQRGLIEDAVATIKPAAFQLHSAKGKSEKEKKREEKLKAKYRQVGDHDGEEAWEMLERLEQKLAKTAPAKPAESSPAKAEEPAATR
jgi:tetratricopeptide (TPR) repeat protein